MQAGEVAFLRYHVPIMRSKKCESFALVPSDFKCLLWHLKSTLSVYDGQVRRSLWRYCRRHLPVAFSIAGKQGGLQCHSVLHCSGSESSASALGWAGAAWSWLEQKVPLLSATKRGRRVLTGSSPGGKDLTWMMNSRCCGFVCVNLCILTALKKNGFRRLHRWTPRTASQQVHTQISCAFCLCIMGFRGQHRSQHCIFLVNKLHV